MFQVYAGLGGANYPEWPEESPDGYADAAAKSLIAYAKTNKLAGYDLDFENGLNDDWVKQWTSIVFQLEVTVSCLLNSICTIGHAVCSRAPLLFASNSNSCALLSLHRLLAVLVGEVSTA